MAVPSPIRLADLTKLGVGLERPEDVVIDFQGVVWAADKASACARVSADGSLERYGAAGGEPNGITIDPQDGSLIIANIGSGCVQRLRLDTNSVEVMLSEAGGEPIATPNYVAYDTHGRLWGTVSTRRGQVPEWLDGTPDGFVFCLHPNGDTAIVADGLQFANGAALDAKEEYLYVAQSTAHNVVRYRIQADGGLGSSEVYGPATLGEKGIPDGIAFDADGNLWMALIGANRIDVITPEGEQRTIVEDPDGEVMLRPTNVSFGGADLCDVYFGSIATNYILKGRSSIPGLRLVHQ